MNSRQTRPAFDLATARRVIFGNTSKTAGADAKMATWAGSASCFDRCIGSVKINDSCIAGEEPDTYRFTASRKVTVRA